MSKELAEQYEKEMQEHGGNTVLYTGPAVCTTLLYVGICAGVGNQIFKGIMKAICYFIKDE